MRVLTMVATLAAGLALAGCDSAGSNPTSVVEVQGKFLAADGKPGKNVALTFSPTQHGGTTASANVGPDGRFTPLTLNNQKGIVPGEYKVVIQPAGAGATPVAKKYADESSTDLKVQVNPGDSEVVVQAK